MGRQTWIANALRAEGLNVVEVAGWQTRGSSTFNPQGSVDHHTAGPLAGNAPSLRICINGRSDLPGPLCNVFVARDNTCYVVAAGRANHAGRGGWRGLTGNSSMFGVERENVGYANKEPWRPDQTETAAKVHRALLKGINRGSEWLCEHKEWAPGRKIDAHTITGDELRAMVVHGVAPKPTPPPANDSGMLREGSRGPRVVLWQTILINAGHLPKGSADGIFGPKTKAATIAFQRRLNVSADGIVGPQTDAAVAALFRYLAALEEAKKAPQIPAFPGTVQLRSHGYAVRQVQQRLKDRGWRITVDGVFGPATDKVVRAFQREKGLAVDGIVGRRTWGAMWTAPL